MRNLFKSGLAGVLALVIWILMPLSQTAYAEEGAEVEYACEEADEACGENEELFSRLSYSTEDTTWQNAWDYSLDEDTGSIILSKYKGTLVIDLY